MTRHHWHKDTGAFIEVNDDEETPKDYIDTHPDNLALQRGNVEPNKPGQGPKTAARPTNIPIKDQTTGEPGDKPLTRAEVILGLKSGGLEFNPKTPTPQLDKTLHEALAEVLAERGVENIELLSTRQMLVAMEVIE